MTGFTFDPKDHIGRMNGEIWPSVTQLLQEFGLIDYSGVPDDILENKRILGTRVHAATILLDECRLDEEHFNASFPECIQYLEAYRNFRIIEKFEPFDQKSGRMFSKKWKFHGEPDEAGFHLMQFGNDHYIIDYKCTFKMFESTGAQTSGYDMLYAENLGIKAKKRFGLLLKPNGKYDLVPFKDPNDMNDFKACLWLHWQKRNKYKTSKGVPLNGNS